MKDILEAKIAHDLGREPAEVKVINSERVLPGIWNVTIEMDARIWKVQVVTNNRQVNLISFKGDRDE